MGSGKSETRFSIKITPLPHSLPPHTYIGAALVEARQRNWKLMLLVVVLSDRDPLRNSLSSTLNALKRENEHPCALS